MNWTHLLWIMLHLFIRKYGLTFTQKKSKFSIRNSAIVLLILVTNYSWRHPHLALSPHYCTLQGYPSRHQATCFLAVFWPTAFGRRSHTPLRLWPSSHTPSLATPWRTASEPCGCTLLGLFLWSIWMKRNNRLFNGKGSAYGRYFEHVIFLTMTWCKCSIAPIVFPPFWPIGQAFLTPLVWAYRPSFVNFIHQWSLTFHSETMKAIRSILLAHAFMVRNHCGKLSLIHYRI